jgi:hypothetical protein
MMSFFNKCSQKRFGTRETAVVFITGAGILSVMFRACVLEVLSICGLGTFCKGVNRQRALISGNIHVTTAVVIS